MWYTLFKPIVKICYTNRNKYETSEPNSREKKENQHDMIYNAFMFNIGHNKFI